MQKLSLVQFMTNSTSPILHILPNGTLEFLYNDDLSTLMDLGTTTIQRASTVDPRQENGKVNWYADLSLSQGPILGPFATRDQALAAETLWLNENFLGKNHKRILQRTQALDQNHLLLLDLIREPKLNNITDDHLRRTLERQVDELIVDILETPPGTSYQTTVMELVKKARDTADLPSEFFKTEFEYWLSQIIKVSRNPNNL